MKKKVKEQFKFIIYNFLNFFKKSYIVSSISQPSQDIQCVEKIHLNIKSDQSDYLKHQKLFPYSLGDILMSKNIEVYYYQNVFVDMSNAIAVNSNFEVILESKKYPQMREETLLSKLSSYENFEDDVVFLVNTALNAQYFHIWFDGLVKLYYINKISNFNPVIVISNSSPLIYKQVLGCFKDIFKIVETDFRFIKVKKYGIVKVGYWAKHAPYFSISIRDFFLSRMLKVSKGKIKYSDKFYIKRKTRSILNSKEIEDELVKRGFELIFLEELDIFDQVSLFNNAKFIIGLHGAGLTNLIFSNPKTKVLELQNYAIVTTYYFLAQQLNLEYDFVLPNEFDFDAICDPYSDDRGFYKQKLKDVSFNLEKIKNSIDLMDSK